jgi:anti-sigma factor RsiW
VQCPESLRVQAGFDGELDAVSAADIERHMEHCDECRSLHSELVELRSALRRDLPYEQTPSLLRDRVTQLLDAEDRVRVTSHVAKATWRARPFWFGLTTGAGAAAAAAVLAFALIATPSTNPTVDELLGVHVNSLLSTHLIDVASSDHHTVKPWFAGHTDVSPVVADFASQGYLLIGGRVAYVEHQRAAVVVYRHGAHVINVFVWAASDRSFPRTLTRDGYHLAFWNSGDLQYCAVSDTGWDELRTLERLLQDLDARTLDVNGS